MINTVVLSKKALKDLRKIPKRIEVKLLAWVFAVETVGVENVRKNKSFHDEPLQGK